MVEAFPISGEIDSKAFPFLLMDLHRHGATGSLKVEGPTYQKALYFRSGRVLFGSSNDPRDQLGSILIESGKIAPEQLEEVNTKVGPGSPLAKVLSESGFVSQRELSEAARAKVERILADILGYTGGSFEFEDGVLPKGAVDLKLSTEKLILASVRRIADRGFVLRQLGSLEIVLSPVVGEAERLAEIQADTGGLANHLDGQRTLKEAASLTRLDEFEAAKVACALLFLGIVETVAKDEPAIDMNLDLAQTARMAFEPASSAPGLHIDLPEPDPFFIAPTAPPAPAESPLDPAAFLAPPAPRLELEPPVQAEPAPQPEPEPEPEPEPPAEVPLEPTLVNPALQGAPVFTHAAAPTDEHETLGAEAEEPLAGEPTMVQSAPPRSRADSSLPLVHPPTPQARVRTPAPASREELAALDSFLNTRAHEGPLEPLEKPRGHPSWEPRFSGGSRGVGRKILPAILAVVVLALVVTGVLLWQPWSRIRTVALGGGTPTPAPPTPTTTLAAAPATTTAPAPIAASPEPPSLAPSPAKTPLPKEQPSKEPKATPSKEPAAKESPKAAGRKDPAHSLEEARTLLDQGSLAEAADQFTANLKQSPGRFSIQLLIACSDDTVKKAVHNVASKELYIVPVSYKGRSCYRLCWGIYDDATQAGSATHSLPEYFRKGGATPKVFPTTGLLP